MIQGAIFDLGSTLIWFDGDWDRIWPESLTLFGDALRELGFDWGTVDFVGEFAGRMEAYRQSRLDDHRERTTQAVLEEALASLGLDSLDADLTARGLERLYAVTEAFWKPVPRVEETLDALQQRGLRLALLSNAGDEANVQRLIDKAGLRGYFDPMLISAAIGLRKPAPEPFLRILDQWDMAPEHAVMVGDRLDQDILGAQQIGMHQIWLQRYAEADQPAPVEPERIADSLEQVPALIDELSGKG